MQFTVISDFQQQPTGYFCLLSDLFSSGQAARLTGSTCGGRGEGMKPRPYKERKLCESVPITYRGVYRVPPLSRVLDVFGCFIRYVFRLPPIVLVTVTLTESEGITTAILAGPIMAVAFDAVAVAASMAMDTTVNNPLSTALVIDGDAAVLAPKRRSQRTRTVQVASPEK